MMKMICLVLLLCLAGCATCSSSDTFEQCRTKERDKQQRNSSDAAPPDPGTRAAA